MVDIPTIKMHREYTDYIHTTMGLNIKKNTNKNHKLY